MDARTINYLNSLIVNSFPAESYRFSRRTRKGKGFIKLFNDTDAQLRAVELANGLDSRSDEVIIKLDYTRGLPKRKNIMILRGINIEGQHLAVEVTYDGKKKEVSYKFSGECTEKIPLILIPPADWFRALLWTANLHISPFEYSKIAFLPVLIDQKLEEAFDRALLRLINEVVRDMVTDLIANGVSIDDVRQYINKYIGSMFSEIALTKLMPKRYYHQIASAGFDVIVRLLLLKEYEEDRAYFVVTDESFKELYRQLGLKNVFVIEATQSYSEAARRRKIMLQELGLLPKAEKRAVKAEVIDIDAAIEKAIAKVKSEAKRYQVINPS